jgi:hypothetical protein
MCSGARIARAIERGHMDCPASSSPLWPAIVGSSVSIVGLLLALLYDRGRRYNYLADRWNALMTLHLDEPEFFQPETTARYKDFSVGKRVKYHQHARMHWAAVEDIISNDYLMSSFAKLYHDTIAECLRLHHAWLNDHAASLFNNRKFRKKMNQRFGDQLARLNLVLPVRLK